MASKLIASAFAHFTVFGVAGIGVAVVAGVSVVGCGFGFGGVCGLISAGARGSRCLSRGGTSHSDPVTIEIGSDSSLAAGLWWT